MMVVENKSTKAEQRQAWNVPPQRAREIQEKLRKLWVAEDRLPRVRLVAGLDAAFVLAGSQALPKGPNQRGVLRNANRAIGGVVAYGYPHMAEIERAYAVLPLQFPYIPGLLSFREVPVLLAALSKLKHMPDLLYCDGQGYAHPRRLGLASHLGVLLDLPTIGCAKTLLIGTHAPVGGKAGDWRPLSDEKAGGERIGAVLRTRDAVRPIYVSQGHRVSLESAIRFTLQVCDGFRIPRPTRDAESLCRRNKTKTALRPAIRKMNPAQQNFKR
jgi:deoxyribonuclease V